MPNVGLFTGSEPLKRKNRVVIRFSVEVDELAVYNESYDVDTIRTELKKSPGEVIRRWTWRLLAVAAARDKRGFSACLTRALTDGQSGHCGHEECESLEAKYLGSQ